MKDVFFRWKEFDQLAHCLPRVNKLFFFIFVSPFWLLIVDVIFNIVISLKKFWLYGKITNEKWENPVKSILRLTTTHDLVRTNVSSCIGDFFLLPIVFLTLFLHLFSHSFDRNLKRFVRKWVNTMNWDKVVISSCTLLHVYCSSFFASFREILLFVTPVKK